MTMAWYDNGPKLVDRWYRMNPETEFYVPNCSYLTNGLVILHAQWRSRWDFTQTGRYAVTEDDRKNVYKENRWCEVSCFRHENHYIFYFTGTYQSCDSEPRKKYRDHDWLVKIDSVPESLRSRFEPMIENRFEDAKRLNERMDAVLGWIKK